MSHAVASTDRSATGCEFAWAVPGIPICAMVSSVGIEVAVRALVTRGADGLVGMSGLHARRCARALHSRNLVLHHEAFSLQLRPETRFERMAQSSPHTSIRQREGMLENFSLGSYLLLVDYTSRVVRNGTARVSAEVAGILERLNTSAEFWSDHIRAMFDKQQILGSYFSTFAVLFSAIKPVSRPVRHPAPLL